MRPFYKLENSNNNREINLEKLIKEGRKLKSTLKYYPDPEFLDYYEFTNTSEYKTWKYTSIRFLKSQGYGDSCVKEFKDITKEFEDRRYDPTYLESLIGILESCEAIPKVPDFLKEKKDIDKGIKINMVQKQEQSQSQQVIVNIIINSINKELTEEQKKELINIKNAQKSWNLLYK